MTVWFALAGTVGFGLLFVLSLRSWRSGIRKSKQFARYEFENRSDGGSVGFESFDAATRHHRQKGVAEVQTQLGCLVTPVLGVGFLLFLAAFVGLALRI